MIPAKEITKVIMILMFEKLMFWILIVVLGLDLVQLSMNYLGAENTSILIWFVFCAAVVISQIYLVGVEVNAPKERIK